MPAKNAAASAANPNRGEISLELDGATFVLRPDFEAVSAIDEAVGGIVGLTRRAVQQPTSLTLAELGVVITEGIRAHGRFAGTSEAHSGLDTVKRMIFRAGIPSVVPAVCRFLAAAITGGAQAGNE